MVAVGEKAGEACRRLRDRVGRRDADGIEAFRPGVGDQGSFQKSRSA
jgi:hypothetical protein